MPIKGMTDGRIGQFPLLGRLRKGGEKPEEGIGKDLEYFRFTPESGREAVAETFFEKVGSQPRRLEVYLPFRALDDNWQNWFEKWEHGGMVHRCDRETMVRWRDENGEYHDEPKPCDGGCKQVGRLILIVPQLFKAGHVGYVMLQTTSKHDILNLDAVLKAAWERRENHELGMRGIMFILERRLSKISRPGKEGKRIPMKKWLVFIDPDPEWAQRELERQILTTYTEVPSLPAPEPDMEEEAEDVQDGEFTEAPVEEAAPDPYEAKFKEDAEWAVEHEVLNEKRIEAIRDQHIYEDSADWESAHAELIFNIEGTQAVNDGLLSAKVIKAILAANDENHQKAIVELRERLAKAEATADAQTEEYDPSVVPERPSQARFNKACKKYKVPAETIAKIVEKHKNEDGSIDFVNASDAIEEWAVENA